MGAQLGVLAGCQGFFVKGCDDVPGFASLPKFHPKLFVGNRYSASAEHFDEVVSTVIPLDKSGAPCEKLSTHFLLFEDEHGLESDEGIEFARQRIVEGAALVDAALREGRRTLVHCEWGQNRSGSICCAYAVLYLGWDPEEAMEYMRSQNLKDRSYFGQCPMSNACFNELMHVLAKGDASSTSSLSGPSREGGCCGGKEV